MRKLWLQVAHTSGASVLSIAASFLSLLMTARLLGPEGRGLYAAAIAWVGLFAAMGTLSLGQVIVHSVAGRSPSEWLGEITGTALAITAGATIAGWLLVLLLYLATGGALFGHIPLRVFAIAFAALPCIIWIDTGRYVLTAIDALPIANWAQIASATAAVAGIALLVGCFGFGVEGAAASSTIASTAAAAVMARHVLRKTRRVYPSLPLARKLLRGSAQLHLNAVGNYLFTQASVLILNFYRPAAETGFYQLAMQLFGFALIVSTAVSSVSFTLVSTKGPNGAWPEQRVLIGQSLVIIALVAIAAYLLAPLGIRLVAGERFMPTVPLFRMILPALLGATFSTVMASQWIGRGLFREAAVLTFVVGVSSLLLDLYFVPRYGTRGALVSTLVTYGISVLGNGGMALWVNKQWNLERRQAAVVP